ncbi:MAG: Sec-independent protein translocase TatC [Ferruginibacter sp.]|nr:Sec-independent protein translocase TatC [Ferruginibacter sp.]
MSFIDHLEALRWHLVRAVIAWAVAFVAIFVKIDWVFDNIIYAPARSNFVTYGALCNLGHKLHIGESLCMPPVNIPLQGNTISGPFMSALSISMIGGIIVAFPYLFWELWKFVKPALSEKEVRYSRGSIFWVSVCFFAGAAFGYFLLAPFTFNFLANFTLGGVGAYKYMPTLDDYIDTINNIILGCGLAFELPILAFVLAKIGIISHDFLKKYRKYAFVIILIVAAVITPSPDWTSQALVSVPLLLLYWISELITKKVDKQRAKEEKEWS